MVEDRNLEKRISDLLADRTKLQKVVAKEYEWTKAQKRRKNFFDGLYPEIYTQEEIEDRPFLNIGPGSFRHKYWKTVDKLYDGKTWNEMRRESGANGIDLHWDFYERHPLPVKDESILAVYCSHVIEHGFDDDVLFLLKECYRVMKEGAVLRLVCPDIRLLADRYQSSDWAFFMHYLSVKTTRKKPDASTIDTLAKKGFFTECLLAWVSLVTQPSNSWTVKGKDAVEFILKFDTLYDAFDRASELSDRDLNRDIGAHVNWFDIGKASNFLRSAGFTDIRVSRYLQSVCPVMRDANLFDRTDPEMSLYLDAVR